MRGQRGDCKRKALKNPAVIFMSSLAVPWFCVGRMVGITNRKEVHPGMFFKDPNVSPVEE